MNSCQLRYRGFCIQQIQDIMFLIAVNGKPHAVAAFDFREYLISLGTGIHQQTIEVPDTIGCRIVDRIHTNRTPLADTVCISSPGIVSVNSGSLKWSESTARVFAPHTSSSAVWNVFPVNFGSQAGDHSGRRHPHEGSSLKGFHCACNRMYRVRSKHHRKHQPE